MKASKKNLISGVLILALIIGAAAIIQLTAPPPVTANVMFDPDAMDLGDPGWTLKEVVVSLWFPRKHDGYDVDPKTVLIEGVLEPKGGWKRTWVERILVGEGKSRKQAWAFRFKVSASSLRDLLWQIIGHMGSGSLLVELDVAGNLYDGEPFTGTGSINVYVPGENPPPPP